MDTTERVAAPATLRVCAALTLELLSSFIVNTMLFPNVALVMPVAREISTYSGAAFSIAVAVAAYVRPSLMREGVWSAACLASTVGAAILLYLGVLTNNTTLLLLGAPFGGHGSPCLSALALPTWGQRAPCSPFPQDSFWNTHFAAASWRSDCPLLWAWQP